ncbi:MAG: HprK-related kinase A [Kiloniellaceae bacterium]
MLIRDIPRTELARLLRGGVHLDTGAFTTHLRWDVPDLAGAFAETYADYPVETDPVVDDFRVAIARAFGGLHLLARKAQAFINGRPAFPPFPAGFAFPMLEATLNWCIARHVFRYVTFHAGAVERGGRAVILIGPSGSGKSTLCAALAHRGWRLLSDELVLLRPEGPEIVANPRPISLKNEAIRLISALAPQARFGAAYEGTIKGTIRFLRAPDEALAKAKVGAAPALVISPSFRPDGPDELKEMTKAKGFMWLVENSVNYYTALKSGFDALSGLTDRCGFYELSYHDLDSAVAAIDRLHDALPGGQEAA